MIIPKNIEELNRLIKTSETIGNRKALNQPGKFVLKMKKRLELFNKCIVEAKRCRFQADQEKY